MRQVALITGGSRGIGRACAERFARAGWSVVINGCGHPQAGEELAAKLCAEGCDVRYIQADVADPAAAQTLVDRTLGMYRHIDALISNAGIAQQKLFTDLTDADWRRMMAVNLDASFYLSRAALPGMISRRSGSILFVSSMWGQVGASCEVHYSAAKAGLIGLTKALAKEVGPSGVRVNCVCPGVIDTEMNAMLDDETRRELADETPLMRLGTADEVARAAMFLCGGDASFITGQILGVNGGFII